MKKYSDQELEVLWNELEDIPFDPETEKLEIPWNGFEIGTTKDYIWHWFDERHSKGVYYLLYEREIKSY